MNSGQLLYQGIRAFKSGQMDEARRLLEQVVAQDEANEMAWLGLSSIIEDSAQRRICLQNVLFLNPDNEVAKERLALLPDYKERRTVSFWRWLTRRPSPRPPTFQHQIQLLEVTKNRLESSASEKAKEANWHPFGVHLLLVGAVSLLLLTALLVVFI